MTCKQGLPPQEQHWCPGQGDRSSTNTQDKRKPFHPALATACHRAPVTITWGRPGSGQQQARRTRTLRCTAPQWAKWYVHTHFISQPGEAVFHCQTQLPAQRSQSKLVTQFRLESRCQPFKSMALSMFSSSLMTGTQEPNHTGEHKA